MAMKRRHTVILIIYLVVAVVIVFNFTSCSHWPTTIPEHGQVVDAVTGKGIPGAEIEMTWQTSFLPMIEGSDGHTFMTVTLTDEQGHYSLLFPKGWPRTFVVVRSCISADGYERSLDGLEWYDRKFKSEQSLRLTSTPKK